MNSQVETTSEQLALQNAVRCRLESLRIRHPSYSLRAFAKKAGVSPATLSLILQGKRKVSRKLASQLSERLLFDPQERAEVLTAKKQEHRPLPDSFTQLTMDQFQLIGDWRAFAILNLIKTVNFKSEVSWIADRLGLTLIETQNTLERLMRLEMVKEENGIFSRQVSKYRTSEDIANISIRNSHAQTLELAHEALVNEPIERRDFSSMTFPLDPKKIDQAKTLIRRFEDELFSLLDADSKPTEVYRIAIQLFPLTKNLKGRSKK